MRISNRRELREDNHKRGRSLESGILNRNKDDDLALFREVQNKEQERFLLQSTDDIDDILFAKLRNFSGYKLGDSNNDLLNAADGDKNDYDWLITPPEPPLFSSLDDDVAPVNPPRRGRPRSKLETEKGNRHSRGSASPHRVSQPGNSTLQSRSRHVSATPPKTRHPSPSRSIPSSLPRSNTPPSRRMSTGGIPSMKTSQNNGPSFSLEAPPNLRTSLADGSASHVRKSSPVSRNNRRSMSPAASRSHDRDSCSSKSRPNSKKPTNILSRSGPKKSSDLVNTSHDTKGPHNMFGPLLSNTATQHSSLASRNSLITNASSDHGASGAHNTIEHEQNQEESNSDYVMDRGDFESKILKGSLDNKRSEIDDPLILDRKNVYSGSDGASDVMICSKCSLGLSSNGLSTNLEVNSTLTNSQPMIVGEEDDMGTSRQTEILSSLVPAHHEESICNDNESNIIIETTSETSSRLINVDSGDNSASHEKEESRDSGGTKARILSLDEATDEILFCSSIVHNIAYEAANIAIDNEASRVEVSQPEMTFVDMTFVDKSSCDERDIRARNSSKCDSKTQKAPEKSMEMDTKTTFTNAENNEKFGSSIVEDTYKGDSLNAMKMEARCNCVIM